MRRNFKVLVGLAVSAAALTSCEKFLDVNENVNNPTAVPAFTILAQAQKITGDNLGSGYNGYAMWAAGYWAKSSIVNGFNEERTLNYTSLYQQGLFSGTYDNLNDYDLIIKQSATEGTPNLAAIAKIMKVYNYQLLVDEYGNIPYSEALQGLGNIKPKYDDAQAIYQDLVLKLDEAIANIAAIPAGTRPVGTEDIVFGGNMTRWSTFAQTLKLRLLMRMSTKAEQDATLKSFLQAEFAKFPTTGTPFVSFVSALNPGDVVIQPGYVKSNGKENPFYERYGLNAADGSSTERNYVQPTEYIISQYRDNRDPRLSRLYTPAASINGGNDPAPANTYLGVRLGAGDAIPYITDASRNRVPSRTAQTTGGLLKDYDMPQPLLLTAESYFLQAEAKLRGYLPGGDAAAKADFESGVAASFNYFYAPTPSQRGTGYDVSATATTNLATYRTNNATNPLVTWDAPGTVTKFQKIWYQKYLALNGADPIEAWSEVRRNDYPAVAPSIESRSPRADKLAVRLLYPQTEVATNGTNVPQVNQFTSRIFWDVN